MDTPVKRVLRSHKGTFGTPLTIPPTPLLHRLGYGTGVEVYRVHRTPSKETLKSPWAVKRITKRTLANGNTEFISERLIKEANILKKLKHPNIIGFRGMSKDDAGRDVLALEICSTSLQDIIEFRSEDDSGPVPAAHALKVIVDMAKALDYLHATALLMHGDIKAPNVLVNGDFEICKLCDFGVAMPVTKNGEIDLQKDPMASYVGTELWSAPEVFEEDDVVTTKADIFAFGCTIYEMLALTAPHLLVDDNFEDSENSDSLNYSREDDFNAKIDERKGKRPELPMNVEFGQEYDRVLEMFFLCTHAEPEKRPTAKDIIIELAVDD